MKKEKKMVQECVHSLSEQVKDRVMYIENHFDDFENSEDIEDFIEITSVINDCISKLQSVYRSLCKVDLLINSSEEMIFHKKKFKIIIE